MGDGGAGGFTRGRRLAVLAVLAVLGASCGGGDGGGSTDDSPFGQARAMLRERATLLAEGDVEGYMAAVAPGAEEQERAIAEGAAAVPLAYVNAIVTPGGPRTDTRIGNALVEVVYRYEGLPDDNRFEFELSYDLERRDGKWLITKSLAGGEIGLPMWATGPVSVVQSEHFLGLHRPSLANPDAALAAAENARRDLAGRLEVVESDPVHLVQLAASEEEYADIKGRSSSLGELASATFLFLSLSRPESRHMTVKAHRLLDQGSAVSRDDGELAPPQEVFQHELAHLALTRFDGPFTPGWVNEGAAMYLAGERRLAAWKRGFDEGIWDDVSIDLLAGADTLRGGISYAYVNAAVLYLIEAYGAEQFFEFYRRFLPLGPTANFAENPTAVVLAETYDISVSELDRRTREYMEEAVAAGQ